MYLLGECRDFDPNDETFLDNPIGYTDWFSAQAIAGGKRAVRSVVSVGTDHRPIPLSPLTGLYPYVSSTRGGDVDRTRPSFSQHEHDNVGRAIE